MKHIIIVPDGMFDNPVKSLGGKTPLQAAQTTNMDHMAKNGFCGLVQTIPDGMPPGSDIGNMAILGYNPKTCHTGRAPLEAANQNIMLADDEVAVRCNLATIANGVMEDYSAGHIGTKEAKELIDALNNELADDNIKFYLGKSYRHTLVLKVINPQKIKNIKTVPPHDILGKNITKYLPNGPEAVMLLKLM
ncbi:MAG: phosphoglycerate mutase, partial [Candidatus Omnitrophica bacterium]|nr:phosphoglycerate mutase [Candidatus Omnitrophota bacterium]